MPIAKPDNLSLILGTHRLEITYSLCSDLHPYILAHRHKWMDGRMDGRTDGPMDGWRTDRQIPSHRVAYG